MEKKFKTDDLWFVSCLQNFGILYDTLDETEPTHKYFIYVKTHNFDQIRADYYSGQLNVPILQFKANYEGILSLVKNKNGSKVN